jgi:hypothetical protein
MLVHTWLVTSSSDAGSRNGGGRLLGVLSVVTVLSVGMLAGCGDGAPGAGTTPPSNPASTSGLDPEAADLLLTFDDEALTYDGASAFPDAKDSTLLGEVQRAHGGSIRSVPGPQERGAAVAFPEACASEPGCPRALIQVRQSSRLRLGDASFSFGATVMLQGDDKVRGANIIQQGRYGTAGGQWKLQVDNDAGRPSCVVRGSEGTLAVWSPVPIDDGDWHQVECIKDDQGLTVVVDGQEHRKTGAVGAVQNDHEVRIGGAGLADGDDRFHGSLDDVFLTIG